MAKVSEVAAAINAVNEQLEKARLEIVSAIAALSASDPDLSPEGNAALDRLKAVAQRLDDVVPDVSATVPVPADAAAPEAAV